MKRKRTDQLISPVELAGGASYSYTTVLSKFSYPPLSVSVCVSLLTQGLSPSLSFLVVIFTKCLGKGSACPQVWIRFAQSLELCLALFALRPVKRVRASEGISYKTPWSCG